MTRARLFCATWTKFHPELSLQDLPQTARSATRLSQALLDVGALADLPVHVTDRDQVTTLNSFDDFICTPTPLAIVYLSSHGLTPTTNEPLYRLATGDTRRLGERGRALPITDILDVIRAGHADKSLLIVDSCYSGNAGRSIMGGGSVPNLRLGDKICVLASSGPHAASIARPGEDLTLFTQNLVACLKTERLPLNPLQIYHDLRERLASADGPEPWIIAEGDAGQRIEIGHQQTSTNSPGTTESSNYDHRATILYMDDEADTREAFRQRAEEAGHSIACVPDPISAAGRLEQQHFDLIVIDLVLADGSPATDIIDVVRRQAPDSQLLVATRRSQATSKNWESLERVFDYPSTVSAFLFKPAYVDTVLNIADRIRDRRRLILSRVRDIEVSVQLSAGRMLRRQAIPARASESIQLQIRICIERLVATWLDHRDVLQVVDRMSLLPIDSGRSICSVFKMTPHLLGLGEASASSLILKLGPRSEIAEEVSRFRKYVQVGIPLDIRTDMVGEAQVGSVGGIIYSLRESASGRIDELSTVTPEQIANCISLIFDPSAMSWYSTSPSGRGSRPILYFEENAWSERRIREQAKWLDERMAIVEGPIRVQPDFVENACFVKSFRDALVHGDLTPSNIVTLGVDRFAIIDYRSVGVGPRATDFARMEAELWLQSEAPDVPADEIQAAVLNAIVPLQQSAPEPVASWLKSSSDLVGQVRSQLSKSFPDLTIQEYGVVLWLTVIRRSALRTAKTPGQRRLRDLIPGRLAQVAEIMAAGG